MTQRVSSSPPHTRRSASARTSQLIVDHYLVLPMGALLALAWTNLGGEAGQESYFTFANALSFAVNSVGMTFFFGLVAKEVVEATAPGGALHTWRRVTLPAVAAAGGMIVPILVFKVFLDAVGEPALMRGWAVPCAIDIALAYFVAKSIFRRHQAIPFLLLLAIVADTVGLMMIALLYPVDELHLGSGAALMVAAIGMAVVLRRQRVKSFWPYVLAGGTLSWLALFWSGLHPALALIPILPFLPHSARDPGFFVEAPAARDVLNQFEHWFKYPVHVVLFFFGLVNAGVPVHSLEPGTWAVPVAALGGRPIGILAAVGLAMATGLHLPGGVNWRDLVVIGFVASIGFSMALFFATVAIPVGPVLDEAEMGALLTTVGAGVAVAAARILHVGRFARG